MALLKLHASGRIKEEFWQRQQAEWRAEEAGQGELSDLNQIPWTFASLSPVLSVI